MTLNEKIKWLRTERNMSESDLAKELGVSARTVLRWERGITMPDIESIVKLSEIFDVSSDMLIKDSVDIRSGKDSSAKKHVCYDEARAFLREKFRSAYLIALATTVIMLSPGITLVIMSLPLSSDVLAHSIGISALFVTIAVAVSLYIASSFKTSRFDYIMKEEITVDYSVMSMIFAAEEKTMRTNAARTVIGTALCILSPLPTVLTVISPAATSLGITIALAASLLTAAIGVSLFLISGIKRSAISALKDSKRAHSVHLKKLEDSIHGSLWTLAIAIYLFYSIKSGEWKLSWMILIFTGAISAIISAAFSFLRKTNGESDKS